MNKNKTIFIYIIIILIILLSTLYFQQKAYEHFEVFHSDPQNQTGPSLGACVIS